MTSESNTTMKSARSLRSRIVGVVTGDKVNKTRKVVFEYLSRHSKYNKYIKRKTVLHVHDEKNESHIGDHVEVMQCRPYSKTKSYRLVRIVTHGPQIDLSAIQGEASQMFERRKEQTDAAAPVAQA